MPDPTALLIAWTFGGVAIFLALISFVMSFSLGFGGAVGRAWKLFSYALLCLLIYVATGGAIASEFLPATTLLLAISAVFGLVFSILVLYGFSILSKV